ncbi:hypothetical protein Cgig2_008528 [Carnegiea gigantea]|uniref:Uncharacterized protein n=1 Tax=Carnegiea gigantea TaxID=171969 RepID=A0A9Q1Q6H9_9CARY|nr:hypothetical protein Cgig2_008528 [Carnegiea gigantea]
MKELESKDQDLSSDSSSYVEDTSSSPAFDTITGHAKRGSLRALRISQATYSMLEEGNIVEFFDKYSMTYMVVHVQCHDIPSSRRHVTCKADYRSLIFTAQNHERYKKGKHSRRKNNQSRQKKSIAKTANAAPSTREREDSSQENDSSVGYIAIVTKLTNLHGKRKIQVTSLDGDEPLVKKRAIGHGEDGRDYTIFRYSVPIVPYVMFDSAAQAVT